MSTVRTIKMPTDEDFFWQLTEREAKHVASLLEGDEFKSLPVTFRALVANFALGFRDPKKRQPLKISLEWLDFIEKLTTANAIEPIGKVTDEVGQKVQFVRPIPETKAVSAEDVALLDAYFGPVEATPTNAKYQRPAIMLPVPEHLRRLGVQPKSTGYGAIKLAIERIRMTKQA
ncbi:hypothetical protein G6M11_27870 [Agrobacterium tumefaciens]|nr:hypothetical protein [Agrobacterium tumefaciens]